MHARSTTVAADPARIDAGIRYVTDEVLPAVAGMAGCIGLSMIVDRESGRCIATSAWADADAMQASAEMLRPMREHAGSLLGGSPQVDEWEIAILHRDHRTGESTGVRCTWLRADPARLDQMVDFIRYEALPVIEAKDGFCSASLLVDRGSARAVMSVTWDSRAALEGTRESAVGMRAWVTRETGATVEDTGEFDLAVAHLRVPEQV